MRLIELQRAAGSIKKMPFLTALRIAFLTEIDLPRIGHVAESTILQLPKETGLAALHLNLKERKITVITKQLLGEGGSKKVWAAVQFQLSQLSSVTTLAIPQLLASSEGEIEAHDLPLLRQEIEIATAKEFANESTIVKSHTARIMASGSKYALGLFSELCDGSIFDLLDSQQYPLSAQEKVIIAQDIATGILCMHHHNFVHGDIKLKNILLLNKRAKIVRIIHRIKFVSVFLGMDQWLGTQRPDVRHWNCLHHQHRPLLTS